MKLAVDARWMVGQTRGMAHYAQALLEPVKQEINALLPRGYPAANYHSVYGGHGFYPYWEQIGLHQLCLTHQIKYLICPYNTAPLTLPGMTKLILIVHDLIYLEPLKQLPLSVSLYQNAGRFYRRMIVPQVISKAHRLITVSHYTRQRISQRFNIPENNITLISNSIAREWHIAQPIPEAAREPYLLTVSGESAHKNLLMLLRAFAAFRRLIPATPSSPILRVVGIKKHHQWQFQSLIDSLGIKQSVMFEPFLEKKALMQRYQQARLFVLPSIIEGFGRPLLEAMASGTPIVCSNTSAFPEIIGDAGWMFNPRCLTDMTNTLYAAWTNRQAQSELAWRGLERVQNYSQSNNDASIRTFWNAL